MNSHNRQQRLPERLYGLLLLLYPERFRRAYGAEMRQTFHAMLDDAQIGAWRLWPRVLADVSGSLLPEHLVSWRRGEGKVHRYAYGVSLGAMLCIAIVATNVIDPSSTYFGLGENLAMLLSAGSLLVFFVAIGFLVSGNTARIATGARIGALTALIGMGIAMLTFLAVDNLFLDIVSKQPEKIWGFEHSQFASMRAYINAGHLRGLVTVLPVFVLVGAACGAIGAALGKVARRGVPNV